MFQEDLLINVFYHRLIEIECVPSASLPDLGAVEQIALAFYLAQPFDPVGAVDQTTGLFTTSDRLGAAVRRLP